MNSCIKYVGVNWNTRYGIDWNTITTMNIQQRCSSIPNVDLSLYSPVFGFWWINIYLMFSRGGCVYPESPNSLIIFLHIKKTFHSLRCCLKSIAEHIVSRNYSKWPYQWSNLSRGELEHLALPYYWWISWIFREKRFLKSVPTHHTCQSCGVLYVTMFELFLYLWLYLSWQ